MIISVNWLKQYVDINLAPAELADKIGRLLVEIESTTDLAAHYQGAVVVEVKTAIDHPNSDHLHVCQIDDGGVTPDVPRNDDGTVQVVCGAPNVHAGMKAVWLPPKTIVPASYGKEDELTLSARKLRGVLSQGMMASPAELDLWDEHDGILEVDDPKAYVGEPLVELLDLNDTLLEVENKSLTHRPDCFGMIGFAREVAAILGQSARVPAWFNDLTATQAVDHQEVAPHVVITDVELCPHYECITLSQVDATATLPLKLRSRLGRNGVRSTTAVVDLTNLLMLESGQPLHAFDLDKFIAVSPTDQPDIVVRAARDGEKLVLLDDKEITLTNKDIVICAGDTANNVPVALAGAMGGKSTEIDAQTKRVLLESATFNLYNLRNTQFRHGIFSEAITRFTKGQPAPLNHPVLVRAVALLRQYTGATVASEVAEAGDATVVPRKVTFPLQLVTDTLGTFHGEPYSADLVRRTLENLQYDSVVVDDNVTVTIPWWRPDNNIREDIIEDIGRVNGYDNIALTVPRRDFSAVPMNPLYATKRVILDRLREQGGNEVLRYSFIPKELFTATHDRCDLAYRIVNAISPDLQYYRRSLLPELLESARDNLRANYDNFMLFEAGKVHRKGQMDPDEPSLPAEFPEVSGVVVAKNNDYSAFYRVKQVVNYVLGHNNATYIRLDQLASPLDVSNDLFEPLRSAALYLGETLIGVVGELKADVRRSFKLPEHVAAFRLFTDQLTAKQLTTKCYTPVLRYQGTARDITYRVPAAVTFAEVMDYTLKQLANSELAIEVAPGDIFTPAEGERNITLHIEFYDRAKTVDTKEVAVLMHRLEKNASQINAKIV